MEPNENDRAEGDGSFVIPMSEEEARAVDVLMSIPPVEGMQDLATMLMELYRTLSSDTSPAGKARRLAEIIHDVSRQNRYGGPEERALHVLDEIHASLASMGVTLPASLQAAARIEHASSIELTSLYSQIVGLEVLGRLQTLARYKERGMGEPPITEICFRIGMIRGWLESPTYEAVSKSSEGASNKEASLAKRAVHERWVQQEPWTVYGGKSRFKNDEWTRATRDGRKPAFSQVTLNGWVNAWGAREDNALDWEIAKKLPIRRIRGSAGPA